MGQKGKRIGSEDLRETGQRIDVNILVDYQAKGTYLFDFCKDLGTGGVFIATEHPQAVGEELNLSFTIPDSKKTLSVKGKVMWTQPKVTGRSDILAGMGIQFRDFTPEQRKLLEEFVNRYGSLLKKPA